MVTGRALRIAHGLPTVDDQEDGTYLVRVATLLSATVKLIVNMDKDLPATTGELPPLTLTFVK